MKSFYLVYPNGTAVEVFGEFLPHKNDTLTYTGEHYFVTRVHHNFAFNKDKQNYVATEVHIELILE